MSDLKSRVGVALWGVPLLLFLIVMGGYYFLLFVLIINAVALWEFFAIQRHQEIYPYTWLGVGLSTVFLFVSYEQPGLWMETTLLILLPLLMRMLVRQPGKSQLNAMFTLGGIAYITFFLAALLSLSRLMETEYFVSGLYIDFFSGKFVVCVIGAIWLCDTAAYFGGKHFGKHKLAPNVSPKKTVEGAFFGLLAAVLAFLLLRWLLIPVMPIHLAVISGVLIGVFGQVGDLVESRFKRDAGVKDSSHILPGHGGILDRFDSFIFVAPVLWLLFYYAPRLGLL